MKAYFHPAIRSLLYICEKVEKIDLRRANLMRWRLKDASYRKSGPSKPIFNSVLVRPSTKTYVRVSNGFVLELKYMSARQMGSSYN